MALDETVPLADDTKINIEGAKFDKVCCFFIMLLIMLLM